MPAELIDEIEKAAKHDRAFSVTLDYLPALVDMRLHLLAYGRTIDAVQQERKILQEIGMPGAVTPTLSAPHAFHTFSQQYAAGTYFIPVAGWAGSAKVARSWTLAASKAHAAEAP